jgi:hypothetical protein
MKDCFISLPVSSRQAAEFLLHQKEVTGSANSVKMALCALKWLNDFVPGLNSYNSPLNDNFLSKIVESTSRNCAVKKNQKKTIDKKMV